METPKETVMQLRALVPPPRHPIGIASAQEWSAAEINAGFEFPQDWKQINMIYGSGWFDGLIWVLSPARMERAHTLSSFDPDLDIVKALLPGNRDIDALIPIAWTRSGAELYYNVGNTPDSWVTAIVAPRDSESEVYEMTVSYLLISLLAGKIRSSILPSNFPSSEPTFASHSADYMD